MLAASGRRRDRRSLRVCSCHLSERNRLHPDPHHTAVSGGFQHRRKNGGGLCGLQNMVGAFHMPRLVYTNLETLLTLPAEQFSSGMGEVIKHGLIQDKAYYEWLKETS